MNCIAYVIFITNADGVRVGWVSSGSCLYVFPHDISKTNAVSIAKLDIEMYCSTNSPGNPFI